MKDRFRVVVADDSPSVCRLLRTYLQAEPDMEVVATALNGRRAVDHVVKRRPDVVTLDLEMPRADGLEALRHIMRDCPTPVVVISGVSGAAANLTMEALDAGAVDFVLKYTPGAATQASSLRRDIVSKVRAAARVRVIRSLQRRSGAGLAQIRKMHPGPRVVSAPPPAPTPDKVHHAPGHGVIVIGASTGGPLALRDLLSALPPTFPIPIVVVQHMPPNFTGVLAAQLARHVSFPVLEAQQGQALAAGNVYIAPGGRHLLFGSRGEVVLREGPDIAEHQPSVDVAMQSAAQIYGARAHGVILTGMGADGALGMVAIYGRNGRTYAQDAASCVVNGMPQRAIDQGVVGRVGPPGQLGEWLAAAYSDPAPGASVNRQVEPPKAVGRLLLSETCP